MTAEELRYAVVGCAGIGETHGRSVADVAGVQLVACSDTDAGNAEVFAERFDCAAYSDVTEMIESERVDAVSVCTPSGTHRDVTLEVADAGAHLLCEKPLDVRLSRVDEMIAACDRAGVTLGGVYQLRTYSGVRRVKRALEAGELGEPTMGTAEVKWHRSPEYYDQAPWRGTRDLDGGVLMNQAVHAVDLLRWLLGPASTVTATCPTLAHDIEVEDTAVVTIEFETGAVGVIEATTATYPDNPVVLQINGRDGTAEIRDGAMARAPTREGELSSPNETVLEGHPAVIQDFVEAIRQEHEPMVTGREARTAVELNVAAYASAALDRPIEIDEIASLDREY